MAEFDLPTAFGLLVAVSVWAYALTAGADFGGGVWDLLASGPRKAAQRSAIAHAIGPIWEANHVWLILCIVLLFVAFPAAYAALLTALHIPIVAMLIGITLRGAAFVFRAYGPKDGTWPGWGAVFAAASAVTPVLLGVILGAASSGAIRLGPDGTVQTDFVAEWWAPFPWAVGAMVLALFAWLAAVYLALAVDDDALRDDFRRRAVAANVVFGLCAGLAAWAARTGAPHLFAVLTGNALAWAMQAVTASTALGALWALWQRRWALARVLAAAQVTLVVAAWAVAQDGHILVGQLTLRQAAAPEGVLVPVLVTLGVGSLVLGPAFWWLFRVFGSRG